MCVEQREPLVVMEDDALLRPNFVSALSEADKLIARFGFIRLEFEGSDNDCARVEVGACGEFTLFYSSRCPFGATCYAIAPRVAAKFVAASRVLVGSRGPVYQEILGAWATAFRAMPLLGRRERPE